MDVDILSKTYVDGVSLGKAILQTFFDPPYKRKCLYCSGKALRSIYNRNDLLDDHVYRICVSDICTSRSGRHTVRELLQLIERDNSI